MAYQGTKKVNPDTGKEFVEGDPKPINPFPDGFKLQKNSLTDGKKMLFVRYCKNKKPYPNGDLKLVFSEAIEKICTYCGDTFETGNKKLYRCGKCRELKWDGVSEGKQRLNPDTNMKFIPDDSRPISKAECGKKYPQDGRLFAGYTAVIDKSTGFYREVWATPTKRKCEACGKPFESARAIQCIDCRPQRNRAYTPAEKRKIKRTNTKPCVSTERIKKFTGCKGEWIPINQENFVRRKHSNGKYYFSHICRKCDAELGWEGHIIRTFNVTADQYYEQLNKQGGGCAICKTTDVGGSDRVFRLFIDHDHISGINRGILCNNCNIMIGDQG
ncbi:MAG TPA: hypothetical protein DCL68_02800, partial [Gammaproteobacteria bacterium]|nr:hypothetical protein [Gammaproteobacteria bacterium]